MEKKREKPAATDYVCRITGENIRRHREAMDWTQEDLEGHSGVAAAHIGRIERGEINPQLKTLEALAVALGVDVGELVSNRALQQYRSLFGTEAADELIKMASDTRAGLLQLMKDAIALVKKEENKGE